MNHYIYPAAKPGYRQVDRRDPIFMSTETLDLPVAFVKEHLMIFFDWDTQVGQGQSTTISLCQNCGLFLLKAQRDEVGTAL